MLVGVPFRLPRLRRQDYKGEIMKHKPIHEHMDGRGMSVRYAYQRDRRKRERKKIGKMMGKSYFTNPNSSVELDNGYKCSNRRPGIFDLQAYGS